MTDVPITSGVVAAAPAQRAAVASQAQLVWWAFRRHKLAMAGLVVTVLLYIIAAAPDFFSPCEWTIGID